MFRPLGNRVVLRRLPLPDTTQGGIVLLQLEWPNAGHVVAVGNKVTLDIRVGDLLYYNKFEHWKREVPGTDDQFVIDVLDCYARVRI